jgi:hypothetical protein
MTNLFAGLKNAKTSERGSYFTPGKYTVKVVKGVKFRTRKNYDAFILEMQVIKSEYENAKEQAIKTLTLAGKNIDLEALESTLPLKEGSTGSWFQSLADMSIGFGALKGFAANVTGITNSEDPTFLGEVEEFLTSVVDERQSLKDAVLPLEVVQILTKEGKPFSLYRWGSMVAPA